MPSKEAAFIFSAADAGSSIVGATTAFTAKVAGGSLGGMVDFYGGSMLLKSVLLDSNFQAILNTYAYQFDRRCRRDWLNPCELGSGSRGSKLYGLEWNTQNFLERIDYSATSPYLVTGLVVGTSYEFKVSAVYPTALTSNYSSSVMATPRGTNSFFTWVNDATQGLTAATDREPMNDPDRDGISNLMEFVLGGSPMIANSRILPSL